jgi:hypothetical protein
MMHLYFFFLSKFEQFYFPMQKRICNGYKYISFN